MIKSPLASRVGRALCTFLVAVAVIGPAASAIAANIQTDLFVYQNGDTVTVTGDGFGPTESVDLVTTDPNAAVVDSGSATTDDLGNFTYHFVLNVSVPGLYTVTGTGQASGLTASTQFDPPTLSVSPLASQAQVKRSPLRTRGPASSTFNQGHRLLEGPTRPSSPSTLPAC